MELKRVIGKDSKQAMELVRKQFGSDALVISSQRANQRFEMIVAIDISHDASLIDVPDALLLEPQKSTSQNSQKNFNSILHGDLTKEHAKHESDRAQEIVDLFKSEMHILKKELAEMKNASAWRQDVRSDETDLQMSLARQSIPNRLKILLVDEVKGLTTQEAAINRVKSVLSESLFTADQDPAELTGVHAFLGLTGSGKTTLIGKLLGQLSSKTGADSITVINYADSKLGAWSQTQLMCAEFGVKCFRANTSEVLEALISELPEDQCILVDTSGVNLDTTYAKIQDCIPGALMHLVVNSEITRSTCARVFGTHQAWDSINICRMNAADDMWVLIDALCNRSDLRLWLNTLDSNLSNPACPVEIDKLLETALTIFGWQAKELKEETPKHVADCRQMEPETSTLNTLIGLRADPSDRSYSSPSNNKLS